MIAVKGWVNPQRCHDQSHCCSERKNRDSWGPNSQPQGGSGQTNALQVLPAGLPPQQNKLSPTQKLELLA